MSAKTWSKDELCGPQASEIFHDPNFQALIRRLESVIKNKFPDLNPIELNWLNDHCYARYLRARGADLDKAASMLSATISWRRDFKVHEVMMGDTSVVEKESETGKMYVNGKDKLGRPILYMKPRNQNTKSHSGQIRHLVYTLERTISEMGENGEKLMLLIDFKGFSYSNCPSFQTQKDTLTILQDHYPERLGLALMIDAPVLFNTSYKMIKPFIDQITAEKVKFLDLSSKSKREKNIEYLQNLFELDQLEEAYFGKSPYKYSNTDYFKKKCIPHYCLD